MPPDTATWYRAVVARDRRYDGQFLFGVVTTGIYCRPGCPSPAPNAANVRFFDTPRSARDAGLRACLRCRPDAAPGTPASLGTPATVSRALRLIGEGALDRGDVDGLAARLGIGERQLRRLFTKHLGAAPLSVAVTRRARAARSLLEQTDLPMAQVASSAGFTSVRAFNDAIRRAFDATPTALRGRRRASPGGDGRG